MYHSALTKSHIFCFGRVLGRAWIWEEEQQSTADSSAASFFFFAYRWEKKGKQLRTFLPEKQQKQTNKRSLPQNKSLNILSWICRIAQLLASLPKWGCRASALLAWPFKLPSLKCQLRNGVSMSHVRQVGWQGWGCGSPRGPHGPSSAQAFEG